MVEVFKTNVEEPRQAEKLIDILSRNFPAHRINFDLDDCDKILRIESYNNHASGIIETLRENGFLCEELE
ncbi:MAG TPA: hypothetical protein VMT76_00595 [Puia sp.]|nr:hypothetical protein [Puia sp.]